MVTAYLVFIGALVAERLVELGIACRNARRVRARGGIEAGPGHFPAMVAVHVAFLAACALEVPVFDRPFVAPLGLSMAGLVVLAQGLRYWTIVTLGDRWTVRILVEPDRPAIATGPFAWLRHPNYLAVTVEMAAIPLLHSAWITAVVFSAANAILLLGFRIPAEERALVDHCGWNPCTGRSARQTEA